MNATTIDPTIIDRLLNLLLLNPTASIVTEEPQGQRRMNNGISSELAKFGGSR